MVNNLSGLWGQNHYTLQLLGLDAPVQNPFLNITVEFGCCYGKHEIGKLNHVHNVANTSAPCKNIMLLLKHKYINIYIYIYIYI